MTVLAAIARPAASEKTIVEWPSEKKKPTPSERLPSCRNLRVVLSIAAMWSASNAWRRAERVGERAEAGERRVVARVVEEQAPAEQVQEEHAAREAAEAAHSAGVRCLSPGPPTASGGRDLSGTAASCCDMGRPLSVIRTPETARAEALSGGCRDLFATTREAVRNPSSLALAVFGKLALLG